MSQRNRKSDSGPKDASVSIPLSRPDITQKEIDAVTEVLRSGQLALGPRMRQFEQQFAEYIGRKRAVAVNSGTSGLSLCMQAMNIGPGDEVITTPFTFIASSNCIMMTGAKPVFVDIDPVTLNIDPAKIREKITEKTRAIEPVEVFGNPAGIDHICEVADKNNLAVVEDCCEGFGSALNGRMVGTFGKMSVFAFYPNKQITTGEGGLILTDDDDLADLCISLRNQGRAGGGWLGHARLGYNYRLSDINCALGVVQLSRADEIKAKRKQVAKWYRQLLADEDRIILPTEGPGCDVNWFVFVIRLSERYTAEQRNTVLKSMAEKGIQVSNYFPPVYLQPFMVEKYGYKHGDFPIADSVGERTIAIPFYNNLNKNQIQTVCDTLRKCLDSLKPAK
ncbi:MAG: DegT/DnrJ/EryC1/StrS family aminotransferase [Planctomycetota bacterium]